VAPLRAVAAIAPCGLRRATAASGTGAPAGSRTRPDTRPGPAAARGAVRAQVAPDTTVEGVARTQSAGRAA